MRAMIVVMAAGAILAGCSKGEVASTTPTAATPAASATPAFTPQSSTSRADYGGKIERRFRKLDKNQDSKLSTDELPAARAARMMKRDDKNGDGVIDASEWSAAMLARFDKRDANHDGNLTSDENGKRGGGKRGGGRRQMQADDEGDDEADGNF